MFKYFRILLGFIISFVPLSILTATLNASPKQIEFRNKEWKVDTLPPSSNQAEVATGKYRYAIGGRTISTLLTIQAKLKANPTFIPNDYEMSLLLIGHAAANKIITHRATMPSVVFMNPNDLDINNLDQAEMKQILETKKTLRALKENPNVTYDMEEGTIGGKAVGGFKKIPVKDIFEMANDIDSRLGK